MIELGEFAKTFKLDVSVDAAVFQGSRPYSRYIIYSDRAIHISNSEQATEASFYLDQGQYARLSIPEGDQIWFILAENETDGHVYLTPST